MTGPFVSCLCPTYCRSKILPNVLACYLHQDYPDHLSELIILDDLGEYINKSENPKKDFRVVSIHDRYPSIGEKYSALVELAKGDLLILFDDDDIYFPWYISSHVKALENADFSKPSVVYNLYNTKTPTEEGSGGIFHGSIAFKKSLFKKINGYTSKRADFDQDFIRRCRENGSTGDPCLFNPPAYIFRWESTGTFHCQGYMSDPSDETWYDKLEKHKDLKSQNLIDLQPCFDEETKNIFISKGLISV